MRFVLQAYAVGQSRMTGHSLKVLMTMPETSNETERLLHEAEMRHETRCRALETELRQCTALNRLQTEEMAELTRLAESRATEAEQRYAELQAELELVLHSTSWRITRPLRRIIRHLRH